MKLEITDFQAKLLGEAFRDLEGQEYWTEPVININGNTGKLARLDLLTQIFAQELK